MARQSKLGSKLDSLSLTKAIDKRVEAAYYATCSGIQVNIMDIPKVFAEGRKAVAEGLDQDALAARILAFVQTIRQNYQLHALLHALLYCIGSS